MNSIIAATVCGVIMMFASVLVKDKKSVAALATVLFAALLGINIWDLRICGEKGSLLLFNHMLRLDYYSMWFNTLMTGCSLLYVLLMGREIQKVGSHVAEYFGLIFFILCGAYLMSTYNNLLLLFIGIEILSIPQYILAGSDKRNLKSSEASLKYFLMGAFSTGILLMGIALLYGSWGTIPVPTVANLYGAAGAGSEVLVSRFDTTALAQLFSISFVSPLALAGIIFLMIAMAFKVSAAPMHMWTPDVYDGSPTAFTAFMSTVVKAAAFFAFIRLFGSSFGHISDHWMLVLAVVTAATLLVGNVTAVFQQSVKRMLAYSSIAQAGFMLFAVLAVNSPDASKSILIYAAAYSVATIGMFAVVVKLKDYTYDGFNGLGQKHPLLAFVTTIFLFSLAGIPLTGGFMAKYYVLLAAVQQGQLMWLVIFALLMAAISVYYYFRVIMAMYFKTGTPEISSPVTGVDKMLLVVTCIIVIAIGTFPQILLSLLPA